MQGTHSHGSERHLTQANNHCIPQQTGRSFEVIEKFGPITFAHDRSGR